MAKRKMSKKDLATGMVVEYRNGKRRLVIEDWADNGIVLFGATGERFTYLDNFNDDLTHSKKDALDIVAVYNYELKPKTDIDLYDDTNLVVIWTRPNPAVASTAKAKRLDDATSALAQLCDSLGFELKKRN